MLANGRQTDLVCMHPIFSAKFMLLMDSAVCFESGERCTMTRVLLSPSELPLLSPFLPINPLKLSSKILVSWQFLNGICRWFCLKAKTTFPSSERDLLMAWASFSSWPVAFVCDTRSEPARSTRFKCPRENTTVTGPQIPIVVCRVSLFLPVTITRTMT